jgi:hypothetical protein
MRTITADKQAMLTGGRAAQFARLSVKDAGGTWRDLSTLFGRDWLVSWSMNADLDSACATLQAEVAREAGGGSNGFVADSLSPLMDNSRAWALASAPLITAGSELLLETSLAPAGTNWGGGEWEETFRGYVDTIDFGKNPMTIAARDYGGKLEDLFIRADKQYSGASMESVMQAIIKDAHGIPWTVATAKVAQSGTTPGDVVTPTTQNGFYYRATVGGNTHATTQPTWPTTIGNTVSDNTVTWRCEGVCPTLWVPSSPSFNLNTFIQPPMSVMEALRKIADVIGWDVRYSWNPGPEAFELKLYAPVRTTPTSLYTWDRDHYFKDPSFQLDKTSIRNHVEVTWSDPADTDNLGRAKRKTTTVTDWASMLAYTNKLPAFCSIAEAATSQIDTSGEASTLAGRILSDLKDPKVQAQYSVPLFGNVELGDYYTFEADDVAFEADQDLAVTGYTHEGVNSGAIRTTFRLRGIPSSGVDRWLAKESKAIIPVRVVGPGAPTIGVSPTAAGIYVNWSNSEPRTGVQTEVHVSAVNGFTPSSSTLWGVASSDRGTAFEINGLASGTWYVKAIFRDKWGNVSAASSQATAVVGGWTAFSFSNNWSDVTSLSGAGYEAAAWRHDLYSNALQFRGFIWRTTGTPSGAETVATLPVPARPLARKLLWAYGETVAAAPGATTFRFQTNGILEWRGGTGYDGWISLFNWVVPLG